MNDDKRPHATYKPQSFQLCGAKTRNGTPCKNPCIKGKKRCRMHGCAPGSGGQPGNKNALKHGMRSREAIAQRKYLNGLVRNFKELASEYRRLTNGE